MKPISIFTLTLSAALSIFTGCSTAPETQPEVIQTSKYKKCIAAPYLKGGIVLDGSLDEKVWKDAEYFDDFVVHRKQTLPRGRTEARIFHDEEYLYLGLKCYEKREDMMPINGKKNNLWNGDCIEMFLGNIDPEPHVVQLGWSSGDARYAAAPFWEHKSKLFDDYWSSETRVKLSALHPVNSTLKFHLARLRKKAAEQIVWEFIGTDFNGLPTYSELILGSYNQAIQVKFQKYPDHKLTRAEYEALNAELSIPVRKVEHGPWLFAPSETGMSIGWYTHGRTGGTLEYRKQGDTKFLQALSHFNYDCQDKDKRFHKVHLKNLQRGTTYEYRIKSFCKGKEDEVIYPADGSLFTFTTHGKKDLTFAVFSDVHGAGFEYSELLNNQELMGNCDMIVNLGDMLSNSTGRLSIVKNYLSAMHPFASKKPLMNFRGNHEEHGCSPSTFFDVFGTPDFKGYSMTRFGDVCLIGLDVSSNKQHKWLKEAIKHQDFQTAKHRILLIHYPTTHKNTSFCKKIMNDLDGIFTGKDPAATIDLLVAGHTHHSSFTPKNTGNTITFPKVRKYAPAAVVPFDVVVNEGTRYSYENCITIVEAKGDSLVVKLISLDGTVSKEYKIK